MKRLITSLLLILAAFAASAQSKKLPIGSVAAGASHNELLIRQISGQVYATSMVQSNGLVTYFSLAYDPHGIPKAEEMAALVKAQPLNYKLTNPSNDWVSKYVGYYSADGDNLFSGGTSFKLVQVNGNWIEPTNTQSTRVTSYLGQYVPVYEPGALYAQIILRDSAGNARDFVSVSVNYNSATGIGKIMFPSRYLGQRGECMVYYAQKDQNGNITNQFSVAFDMGTDGHQLTPVAETTSIDSDFSQIQILGVPNAYMTNVASYSHFGSSPLGQITVPNAQVVFFAASTTEGEYAINFKLKKLELNKENEWIENTVPIVIPNSGAMPYFPVFMQPGVYHVDFEWLLLAPYPAYEGGSSGGGGGGEKGVKGEG